MTARLANIAPYLFLGIYIAVLVVIRGKIPQPEELIDILKNLYGNYGYYIIFVGAFLEATFLISLYVPGSTVILLGAALSRTGVVQFPIVLVLAIIGLLCGYTLNYVLGKYGWYHVLEKLGLQKGIVIAKNNLEKHGTKAIMLGYTHPTSASFLSTAAGVLAMPFQKFISVSFVSQVFWALLWGSIAYLFGLPLVEFFIKYFGYIAMGIIALYLLKNWRKKQ